MSRIFFFMGIALIFFQSKPVAIKTSNPDFEKEKILVSGTITQTSSYCGGAEPDPEELKTMGAPYPFSGKQISFIKGEANLKGSSKGSINAVTDEKGNYSVQLSEGKWCMVEPEKLVSFPEKIYLGNKDADLECLRKNWETCLLSIVVENSPIQNLNFNFHHNCPWEAPCITYRGSYPP